MSLIGLTGRAGAGKSLVGSMLPGHRVIGLADPLYAGLSTMLGVAVDDLRDRALKERPIPWLGRSPRELLQTLGTDWGRDLIADDLWVTLARRRIAGLLGQRIDVAVADVRFANEAQMIRSLGGRVWLVVRPGAETTPHSHRSENGLPDDLVDRVVANDCDLDELRRRVAAMIQEPTHA